MMILTPPTTTIMTNRSTLLFIVLVLSITTRLSQAFGGWQTTLSPYITRSPQTALGVSSTSPPPTTTTTTTLGRQQQGRPPKVNFRNFWIRTRANFTTCDPPDREPDFVSRSGSAYWDEGDGITRTSDHWTGQHGVRRIVDCYWQLDRSHEFEETATGRCDYTDFVQIKKKGRKTLQERGIELNKKEESVDLVSIRTTFDNFWRNTNANFCACQVPDREPDFVSKSGSSYWDEGDAVVRMSDHWTGQHGVRNIVNCYWVIDTKHAAREAIAGRCSYDKFVYRKKKNDGTSGKNTWRKIGRR